LINILLATATAFAAFAFGWGLNQFVGVPLASSAIAGALIFVLAAQTYGGLMRARLRRVVEREIDTLKEANATFKVDLNDTKRKMTDVTTALALRGDAQEKKVVGELQMLEGLIREFATNIAHKSREQAVPLEDETEAVLRQSRQVADNAAESYASALTDPHMLETIRRSLEENRVDLYLQPTVSLPQRKVRYYEALSRLRSEDGAVIMPAQYIKVAAPAGLMSVVDNLLLFRCVQIMRRLTQRRRDIGVFCNISGHTLTDSEFFPQFLEFMHHHRDLAGQIVFEFTQDSVMAAKDQEEANLRYLSGMGFQLSMDQVTTLGMDFTALHAMGFRFLKVRADTLVSGMQNAKAAVAAEDFKDLLLRNNISLIVERIEDEKTVVQLLDFNVDYGQGYLFGGPKPIREMAEANDTRAHQPQPNNVAFLSAGLARRLAG
jgi:cyclic-di-GMP phosphodiesterase TipF (flagellum assembly factor)